MSLNDNLKNHFSTSKEDLFNTKAAINGLPRPSIMAGILTFEDIPNGDYIQEFTKSIMDGEEVDIIPLLSVLRDNCMGLIDMFKEEMGDQESAPLQQLIIFDKFVVFAQSCEITSNKDKELFVKSVEVVVDDISHRMKASPILSIMIGEVWSFQLRKSWCERIKDMPSDAQGVLRKQMIESIYNAYGSISVIPEDHPAVVKFDCFMFFVQFNSDKGSKSAMGMKIIDENKFDEMEDDVRETFHDLKIMGMDSQTSGRLTVDVSKFAKIKIKDED